MSRNAEAKPLSLAIETYLEDLRVGRRSSPNTLDAYDRDLRDYMKFAVRHGLRDWREATACVAVDTNLFFPTGLTGYAIDQTNVAKSVCHDCPVRPQCLEFALRTNQDHGVWGGATEEERRVLRRQRRAAARRAVAAQSRAS